MLRFLVWYVNPFKLIGDHRKKKLYNLSSGVSVVQTTAGEKLDLISTAKTFYENFRKERLTFTGAPFHAAIKQNENWSFT